MVVAEEFQTGTLVKARDREWVVLPENRSDLLKLRPLGGSDDDATFIYLPLEPTPPTQATFDLPDPSKPGSQSSAVLLRDALRLKLRAGAGPFRSFGNLAVEPRAYQLVPLLMALKQDIIRLLIADDVGIGKTIEAGLIARELLDRGEIEQLTVICPPHLCEQWQQELETKFNIQAQVVRTGTASRLERGLPAGISIFEFYPFTIVSLDFIKSDRRRDEFLRACPEFVIIDEAHTCVQASTTTRHQRYQLVSGLANADPVRHMVFLTATPHSGDDDAFHNLLGLLDPKFQNLLQMPEGDARRSLREELAFHFVQRRRADIAEWNDQSGFPERESMEATYSLTGGWGELFDNVLAYAREMVERVKGESLLKQRMNWWAALALLRCLSSSPAAAALALNTRLQAVEGKSDDQQIQELESQIAETVMDGQSDELLNVDETVPAGTTEFSEDITSLTRLIEQATKLKGRKTDPKLDTLAKNVEKLLDEGFKPVIFCRYIATAHYVAENLAEILKNRPDNVLAITGEFTSDQREEKIEALGELEEDITPVLVATDCLSEGINLQNLFDTVVHYDLVWNPTRHEQREGRVDRFGQSEPIVRAMMIYGENNPVDGAVLQVILRKAEKIRKELGVSVPLPADNNKVMDAIMKVVFLQAGADSSVRRQMQLDFGETEEQVERVWEKAKDKERESRTIFAQRRLRPDDVLPEWNKAISVFGSESDVERFVKNSATRLNAPLDIHKDHFRFPITHLPAPLQDRLEAIGITKTIRITFSHPAPNRVEYIYRAHPLVAVLAEYLAEQSLEELQPDLAARCGAIFTEDLTTRTVVYLLRLRSQLAVEKRDGGGSWTPHKMLLSEECIGIAVKGTSNAEVISEQEALDLLQLDPSKNMEAQQQTRLISSALDELPNLEQTFDQIAESRAEELLTDHRRVREASDARGIRYGVTACKPVDKIGVYVLNPAAAF